jgi:peptide/nickel transport system permease protein
MKLAATVFLVLTGLVAACAPLIAPYPSGRQFPDHLFAPPMRPHIVDEAGVLRAPFVYPLRMVNRLERRYEEDRSHPVTLVWFSATGLVSLSEEAQGPLLLLGSDALGRDVLSRLVLGAHRSLGVAVLAAAGALLLGAFVGGVAGFVGGALDEALMRLADFILVLPAIYVVLALRAAMPLVLPAAAVFMLMVTILALVGWPSAARGVRAIVAAERRQEYASAAVSLGASATRLLFVHLLPATYGYLLVQATLLVPSFILAEATLSYVGLGFAEPTASWGAMLKEAADLRALVEFPWLLAPGLAIVLVVLAINVRFSWSREGLAQALPTATGEHARTRTT